MVTAGFTVLAAFTTFLFLKTDTRPIYGIYRRPGKFFLLKYWIFRCVLYLRKKRSRHVEDDALLAKELDRPQTLSESPKAFDAVFFIAVTQDGFYVVAGSERRKHNIVNGVFYVVVPGLGLLCGHKIPDTVLFDAEDDTFGAEGLLLQPLEPMRKWKLTYTGEMWLHVNPTKQFSVAFSAVFTSALPIFHYDTDLDPGLLAAAIANEPWTLQYFKALKKSHQCHYEQMGNMEATLTVNTEVYNLTNMAAFRDHSYGVERDWELLHRYVFHMIFLEDGTKAAVGVICHPTNCSVLQTGYVVLNTGLIHPITWCDFKLYQHGENGTPPKDYAFSFKAGKKLYTVEVKVEHESVHYLGWKWEARMVERMVVYKVGGVRGRGVSEWHYKSHRGRPPSTALNDPAWFSDVVQEYYSQ
ncbi:uncharacterized protein LOC129003474 [Macrosteles quadrilineatus]|uniref:uncharacterized protein LOC129003474 n=1 Tax=Macrosteles quadrilineatus TaxID=74068 RepID=UPI0023E18923|nr:uncharacterized protein LOC129003474 [Macrosteles quadrilineatus]